MGASCLVVLWHKIVLSPPVWFLVEVIAKRPWKWCFYSSVALTSFFPILVLIAFALGSVMFGLIALVIVQCGLLTLAVASLLSSAVMIAPVALLLTFIMYVMYRSALLTARAARWLVALPTAIYWHTQQELRRVSAGVSGIARNLCFWQNFKEMRRKGVCSEVRSRAARRIRQRNVQHLSDSDTERQTTEPVTGTQRQQQGILAYIALLKQTLREDSVRDRSPTNEKQQQSRRSSNKSKGWLTWLNQTDSSILDSDVRTCRQVTSSHPEALIRCGGCTRAGAAGSSLSSDDETIKFTSGSGSDSYHTADEWLAEDCIGNVIPDYRDRESKLYDALLKRDFCHDGESYMYY